MNKNKSTAKKMQLDILTFNGKQVERMSEALLQKAYGLCKEVAEHSDYYGMDGYSEQENNDSILFIYQMLVSKGEAETLKWLLENGFLD